MLSAVFMLLIFACKQQPAGNPDPCAQYPGSICPGQRHPSGEGNQHEDKERSDEQRTTQKDEKDTEQTQDNQKDANNQADAGEQANTGTDTDSRADSNADDTSNADSASADRANEKEVELSALRVYAYFSREQLAKPHEHGQQKLPSNEQGYVVGFYLSAWRQLSEEVRKQIVSTLVIEYDRLDFAWQAGNVLTFNLPMRLRFTAADKKHCWRAELRTAHLKQALHRADFIDDDNNNRVDLRNFAQAQGSMQAMTHSTGDCR